MRALAVMGLLLVGCGQDNVLLDQRIATAETNARLADERARAADDHAKAADARAAALETRTATLEAKVATLTTPASTVAPPAPPIVRPVEQPIVKKAPAPRPDWEPDPFQHAGTPTPPKRVVRSEQSEIF